MISPRRAYWKGLQWVNNAVTEIDENCVRPFANRRRLGGIVMFHLGRSGSTVVCNQLKQSPDILWKSEIYTNRFTKLDARQSAGEMVIDHLAEDPIRLVRKEFRKTGARYLGFEVKPFHLNIYDWTAERYVNELTKMGVKKYILLKRRNYLRKIVSSVIAREMGTYHLRTKSNAKPPVVRLDVNEVGIDRQHIALIDHLEQYDRDLDLLEKAISDKDTLFLTYEEDVEENPAQSVEKITAFLGVPPYPTTIGQRKINARPISDSISNYQEVESVLRGTRYEWMLVG